MRDKRHVCEIQRRGIDSRERIPSDEPSGGADFSPKGVQCKGQIVPLKRATQAHTRKARGFSRTDEHEQIAANVGDDRQRRNLEDVAGGAVRVGRAVLCN